MYTDTDQPTAVSELGYMEKLRSLFAATHLFGDVQAGMTTGFIGFSSKAEFSPYAIREVGEGYYMRTLGYDYIVTDDMAIRNRPLCAHEYTHLVVEHAGLELPLWLNEGLAEFYSSIEEAGAVVTVGRPLKPHLETLHRNPFIPLDALFAVQRDSPYYSEGKKVSMFYAQSWALVHMLELDARYSSGFKEFIAAVSNGQSSAEALQSIYHKTVPELTSDLSAYIQSNALPVLRLTIQPETSMSTPLIGRPSAFDLRFTFAMLLSGKPATVVEAEKQFTALASEYPQRPEPEAALGMLAFQRGSQDAARYHLGLACQRNSTNAEAFYDYAALQLEAGAKNADVAALMRRALELQPSLDKARLELGLLDAQDLKFQASLTWLSGLRTMPPGADFEVYLTMAQCYSRLNRSQEALTYGRKAQQAAETPEQQREAASLLDSLNGDAAASESPKEATPESDPALTSVFGKAQALECADGKKWLRVQVGGNQMVFDVDDPDLVVRNAKEEFSQWKCGPMKPAQLTVVFTPGGGKSKSPQKASDGRARELVFASSYP